MYLVTRVLRETNPDAETGELVSRVAEVTVNVLNEQQSKVLRRRVADNDHRAAGARIFRMEVDDEGLPTIGLELGWQEPKVVEPPA